MTDKQAEALRLADALEDGRCSLKEVLLPSADELRRLHARVVELEALVALVKNDISEMWEAGEISIGWPCLEVILDRDNLTVYLEAIGSCGVESLRKKGNA